MSIPTEDDHDPDPPERGPLTLTETVASALAAAFGVQSSRNRTRDFSRGRPGQFIAVGAALTVLLILGIAALVHLVLAGIER
jgi:hypothetical protein